MSRIVDPISTESELEFGAQLDSADLQASDPDVVSAASVTVLGVNAVKGGSGLELGKSPSANRMSVEIDTLDDREAGDGIDGSDRVVDPVLYAEDLSVGDCWTTEMRAITADDVQSFAELTGDHTPLHGDQADQSPYGKPIAHGLLGLSILAGLGTRYPKASTLAFVSVEEWQFLAPVFFGDRVQAKNRIVAIEPHGRRAAKVRWLRQLINDSGRVVQEGQFVTLVGSKNRSNRKAR